MADKDHCAAMKNAEASVRMEGFDVTEQTEKDCVRLISGEVSVADLVKGIMARSAWEKTE